MNQYFQSLDLRRNPSPEYRKLLVEQMRGLYGHRRFDLIITMYPEALGFVLNEGRTILPDAPILALYLPADTTPPKADRPIFHHYVTYDALGTLEIALKLVPGAKRVYVVSGAHALDRQLEEQARRAFRKWDGRLEFQYLSHLPLEEVLATLEGAPRDAIVLFLAYANDPTGRYYTTPDVTRQINQVSAVPVFGVLRPVLGHGIVGGSLISFEGIGIAAGRLASDILRGAPPPENTSPILNVPAVPMFDWRQLRRWNLSADAVPPGSMIINREYTLWERYGTEMIVAFSVFVMQALLIAALAVSRAQRQHAETKLAEQLRIETLVAGLSASLVNLPADQIESAIHDAQRRICDVFNLDRSTLLQVSPDGPDTMRLTHVYTPAGMPPFPLPTDMRDLIPWALQKVLRGETLIISTLAALPPEAARDREFLQRYGTKALVAIPLVAEGRVLGALSFAATRAERAWPGDVVKGLRLVAEVIATAIARARADRALRETQARLTLAAASADVRLWEVNAETGRVWMTEEGRAFYGLAPNEMLTLDRVASFIHPDDRESWRESIRESLESGKAMRTEFRTVSPDGSIRWYVGQGRPSVVADGTERRLLGVSIDITERKQIEERLRTSEALSAGVLSSLPGRMVIMDRSGAILRASQAWRDFAAGSGASDLTVLAIRARLGGAHRTDDREVDGRLRELRSGIAAVLAGTQAEFRSEYPFTTPTEERWGSVSVLPLQRAEGGAVIYHQDITAQQRSRLETERLRRDLTHVGRVTTMGEMAAALAHELNQPLTAILSNAHAGERFLERPAPPLDEIREILQDVIGDARRAGDVIQGLRGLLRKDEARFLPLDVNQVIQEMAVLVRTDAILRNLALDLELAPDLPAVRGDRVQLQQVLLNLVLNGMEAVGSQGEGERIAIRTRLVDTDVCVAVRDEGHGIPTGALPRLFETFYTTKAKGIGMGLSISRTIVEAHGGRVWAENNPDRGATFSFTLPVCPPDPSPA